MDKERNVFLIGPRACGKTSVGRMLAERLRLDFVDTDHRLVADVGSEIAEYVEAVGWDAFRDKETEVLKAAAADGPFVVGCGGGIVLRKANREVLASGVTIYLKTDPHELVRRLMQDPNEAQRPSLTGRSLTDEVRDILAERAPLYEGCADAVVSGDSPGEVVELIMNHIGKQS